jgi:hypothetical protein
VQRLQSEASEAHAELLKLVKAHDQLRAEMEKRGAAAKQVAAAEREALQARHAAKIRKLQEAAKDQVRCLRFLWWRRACRRSLEGKRVHNQFIGVDARLKLLSSAAAALTPSCHCAWHCAGFCLCLSYLPPGWHLCTHNEDMSSSHCHTARRSAICAASSRTRAPQLSSSPQS